MAVNAKDKALEVIAMDRKAVYGSVRDALAYRELDRDPGNRDVVNANYNSGGNGGGGTPRIDHALQLSTIWACVRLISGTISTLPLFVYERTETNGRETRAVAREHPLYALLHDSPNADMTAVEFWECAVMGLLLWGNTYVLKTYGARDRLVALDPLNPALMTVMRTLDGDVRYLYADPRGQREYTERDIWHIKGFGSDGLVGLSPIGMGWRSVVGAANISKASSELFGKSMKPDAVLSTKEILTPDQRRQMKDKLMGSLFGGEGHRMMLLEATDYKQLTISPLDAQMVEQSAASVEDLCRWFQVPPSMIGHGTAVSNWGTGREQINLGFLQYVLDPYLVRFQQSIAKHLLTAAERRRYFAEFSREGLLRADSAGRAAFYSAMTQNGIYTRNFCRSLENLEPLEGGDELTVQSNLVPLSKLGEITSTAQNDTIAQDTQGNDDELPDQSGSAGA